MAARTLLVLGALNAALAVIAGAYGAHALKDPAPAALFRTAVQYHMFHAIGLIALGILAMSRPNSVLLVWSGAVMFAGIVLFCGSFYVSTLIQAPGLRAAAPFGGTAFIVSWILLAVAVWRW
jgi:uncharacterized membrane protein YgdD (TMEM256/DUF423 family)